jgi:hypothetical protein
MFWKQAPISQGKGRCRPGLPGLLSTAPSTGMGNEGTKAQRPEGAPARQDNGGPPADEMPGSCGAGADARGRNAGRLRGRHGPIAGRAGPKRLPPAPAGPPIRPFCKNLQSRMSDRLCGNRTPANFCRRRCESAECREDRVRLAPATLSSDEPADAKSCRHYVEVWHVEHQHPLLMAREVVGGR